jgi:cysteine desulfurase/selenocysteine lyase
MIITNKIARKLKKDFPIFRNNRKLIYLDSAATSQRPRPVINAMLDFIERDNANVGRGLYTLSQRAMKKYDESRKVVADFIGAKSREIVFTKNTTESLNLLSYTLHEIIKKGKNEILLTEMEHHSNLVPWQQMAKRHGLKLKFIKVKENFTLDLADAKKKITNKTALVSLCHVSNTLGTINPVKKIIQLAKAKKALTIIDSAQSVSNIKIDVKNLDCDFLVFSGHKMLGPTGIGVLYGKEELLEKLPPFMFGGGMIKSVSFHNAEWADVPEKFEAGTQNIVGAVGLAEAIKYLEKIGLPNISEWEFKLLKYCLEKLSEIPGIEIYNPGKEKSSAIISFNLKGVHPHDVSELLNVERIAVRAGHNCTMPLMSQINSRGGVCRASFSFYNTFEDVDKLVDNLKKINRKFN